MKAREIREGDIVEIDYVTEFAKEHINEGKALVIWKGFNNQPLVRKLDTKATIWTCYEYIARVVGHIDIVGYMDRSLSAEPCDDAVSRRAVLNTLDKMDKVLDTDRTVESYKKLLMECYNDLPPVTPKEKTGRWISFGIQGEIDGQIVKAFVCSECGAISVFRTADGEIVNGDLCPNCGAKMQEVENDTN